MDLFTELFNEEMTKEKVTLRYYQDSAVNGINRVYENHNRALLILPTGTGKTVVYAEVVKHFYHRKQRVLVLAHRDELLDHAIAKIRAQVGCNVSKEKAEEYANLNSDVIVGSIQTMQGDRLKRFEKDFFDLIIVDECFVKGTKINIPGGSKSIEKLKPGDRIYSFNEKKNKIEIKKIKRIIQKRGQKIIRLKINNKKIKCTANHLFFTKQGWKKAKDLNKNDFILKGMFNGKDNMGCEKQEWFRLENNPIQKSGNKRKSSKMYFEDYVYDLEVAGNHNYFVENILVHNCHHLIAKTYQLILKHFEGYKLLGGTATPDRSDKKELSDYFDEVAYQYSLIDAIKEGYLVNIVGTRIKNFTIDLSEMRLILGDFREKDLEKVIEEYIAPITKGIIQETHDLKTMIFLPSVRSAELIADNLISKGIKAAYLSGKHKKDERRRILKQYKNGGITHLCNCNLFTEGFDEPSIQSIVMARFTLSRNLYAQMVGRGTRLWKDKKELKLVEFTCNYKKHNLVTAFELFASRGFEENVRRCAEKQTEKNDNVSFLDSLEKANKYYYSFQRIIDNLKIKEYDTVKYNPFELCNLSGTDLTGELNITWNGFVLKGYATEKQIKLLRRFNIHNPESLTKAQASIVIDTIAKNRWKVNNIITEGQRKFAHEIN